MISLRHDVVNVGVSLVLYEAAETVVEPYTSASRNRQSARVNRDHVGNLVLTDTPEDIPATSLRGTNFRLN